MSSKYKLTQDQLEQDSYKLTVHSLIDQAKKQGIKLLGVSTSMQVKNEKERNLATMADMLCAKGVRLALVNKDPHSNLDAFCAGAKYEYIPLFAQANLAELKNSYDLVLVNLAPIGLFADAMLQAKECDALLLAEKYSKTRHSQFDRLLGEIKDNKLNLLGVIANK